MFPGIIIHGVFDAGSSFHVGWRTAGGESISAFGDIFTAADKISISISGVGLGTRRYFYGVLKFP